MKTNYEPLKDRVAQLVGQGMRVERACGRGRSKFWFDDYLVHIKANGFPNPDRNGDTYRFNINSNSTSADFEVLICGSAALFYVLPVSVLFRIRDAGTYPDNTNSGRGIDGVFHIDTYNDIVKYPKTNIRLAEYRCRKLVNVAG